MNGMARPAWVLVLSLAVLWASPALTLPRGGHGDDATPLTVRVGAPAASPNPIHAGLLTDLVVTVPVEVDPDGARIDEVWLERLDARGRVVRTWRMNDRGRDGDAPAGDGVFSEHLRLLEGEAGEVRFRVKVKAVRRHRHASLRSEVTAVPVVLGQATIGRPQVTPATVAVGESTVLLVTVPLTVGADHPRVRAVWLRRLGPEGEVLASLAMRDDGRRGDAKAHDGLWTGRLKVEESAPGEIRLQVVVFYKHLDAPAFSEVVVVPVGGEVPPPPPPAPPRIATYGVGAAPRALALGDVDGDGRADLVTANQASLSLLVNSGDGTFQPAMDLPLAGLGPGAVAVADMNGDGRADLVVGVAQTGPSGGAGVAVLLRNADGTFQAPLITLTVLSGAATALALAVADLNGDGRPDAVALTSSDTTYVDALLGDGAGGFVVVPVMTNSFGANALALGDVDGDLVPDLALAEPGLGAVTVFTGDGVGGFFFSTRLRAAGTARHGVRMVDLNRDGRLDLVWANASPVALLEAALNNGFGGFPAVAGFAPVGLVPLRVAVGDLNGDGNPDAVSLDTASAGVSRFTGDGLGGFAAAVADPVSGVLQDLVVGDLDGDGRADVATVGQGATPALPGVVTVVLGLP
jgi:hypothetical protein